LWAASANKILLRGTERHLPSVVRTRTAREPVYEQARIRRGNHWKRAQGLVQPHGSAGVIAQAPASLACRIIEIGDLPLYNEDFESDPPKSWTWFRSDIASASCF